MGETVTVPRSVALSAANHAAPTVGRLDREGKPFSANKLASTIGWVTDQEDDMIELSIDQATDLFVHPKVSSFNTKVLRIMTERQADW